MLTHPIDGKSHRKWKTLTVMTAIKIGSVFFITSRAGQQPSVPFVLCFPNVNG